jgi:hypothetical protein
MGETCGMKLVYETFEIPRKCPTCEEVNRKLRKRDKHVANIQRWTMEGTNPASRHRALEEIAETDEALQGLYQKLAHVRTNIGIPSHSVRRYDYSTVQPLPAEPSASIRRGGEDFALPGEALSRLDPDRAVQQASSASTRRPMAPGNPQSIPAEANATGLNRIAAVSSELPQNKRRESAKKFERKITSSDLPITFEGLESPATMKGCADTGTWFNAITIDLVHLLRLPMIFVSVPFKLPNGKYMKACGYVSTTCSFGVESHLGPARLPFDLFVFDKLTRPGFLIGRKFLERTETLVKYFHRFIRRIPVGLQVPCIRSITTPSIWLKCCVNGISVRAIPDTGADHDFMSESFAISQGFKIQPRAGWVAYADDSTDEICGVVAAEVVVGEDIPTYEPENVTVSSDTDIVRQEGRDHRQEETDYRRVVETDFYVVKELQEDVFLGEESLAILQPFRLNQDEFELDSLNEDGATYVNRISAVGAVDRIVETGVSTAVSTAREIARVFASRSRRRQQDIEGRLNVRLLRVFQLTEI